MRLLALLKFILVLALLATGATFLLKGLGVDVPVLKFAGLEGHGVPAGIVFLLVGIALARSWKIKHTHTVIETRKVEPTSDGRATITKSKIDISKAQFMPSTGGDKDAR